MVPNWKEPLIKKISKINEKMVRIFATSIVITAFFERLEITNIVHLM